MNRASNALTKLMTYASASQRPIVGVIGTTGVGKSQLAVSLAQSMRSHDTDLRRGVVLSADSMQLYKGLDVITNKVKEDEMGGVEHWGLNMVTPGVEGSWELGKWCNEANEKISTLDSTTLPIICGGTHYFIQHFLFPPAELSLERKPSLKGKEKSSGWTPPGPHPPVGELSEDHRDLLESFWTTEPVWPPCPSALSENDHRLLSLYRLLEAVNPGEAGRWHWRDGRKVRRGLERWWERASAPSGLSDQSGRKSRFRTLVFWVYQPLALLKPRLDKRVDAMVENGLLREIAELRSIAQRVYGNAALPQTEGIFQSIGEAIPPAKRAASLNEGYKEFAGLSLDQGHPERDPAFPQMLDRMKLSTQQYARSQLKWVKKQFLPTLFEAKRHGGDVWVYVVPGGAEGESVACGILDTFLRRGDMPNADRIGHLDASELLYSKVEEAIPNTSERQHINVRRNCDVCSIPEAPYSVLTRDWDRHAKSKIHKKNLDDKNGGKERRKVERMAQGQKVREQRAALAASIASGG